MLSAVTNASNSGEDLDEVPDAYQQADALRRLTALGLISASENGQLRTETLGPTYNVPYRSARRSWDRITSTIYVPS